MNTKFGKSDNMEQKFQSEFACEMAAKIIKRENLFKSQFAADLKRLHSSAEIADDRQDSLENTDEDEEHSFDNIKLEEQVKLIYFKYLQLQTLTKIFI